MSDPVRWGIVGTGAVSQLFAESLRWQRETSIAAVASRTATRAEWFARRYGVHTHYTDYGELCSDPNVDIVYIATPNRRHCEDALLALSSGKPVLVEKPFALNAAEAESVIASARTRKLFCMEAMWMRFLPLMVRLPDYAANIGDPRMLTAQLGHAFKHDPSKGLFHARGGGATLDLGVYLVSFAMSLFGTPSSVRAETTTRDSDVDEQMTALLSFPGGRLASLSASLVSHATNDAVLLGTNGRLHIHAPLYRPETLSTTTFEPADAGADAPDHGMLARIRAIPAIRAAYHKISGFLPAASEQKTSVRFQGNGYNYEAQEVARCLRRGALESDIMPWKDTLAVMTVLDDIRSQAAGPQT